MVLGRVSLSQVPAFGPLGQILAPEVVRGGGAVPASDLYAVAVIGLLIYSPTGILGILDRILSERRTKVASALRAVAKSRLETAP